MEQKLQPEETDESQVYQFYFDYVISNENLCLSWTAAAAFDLFQKLIAIACSNRNL